MNCTIQNNVLSRFFYGFPKGYRGSDYKPVKKQKNIQDHNIESTKWTKESQLIFVENFMKTDKYAQMPYELKIMVPSYLKYLKTGDATEYIDKLKEYEQ